MLKSENSFLNIFIEKIGKNAICKKNAFFCLVRFTWRCIRELISFSWCRSVVLDVLYKQIYFTACQRLFTLLLLGLVYGGIVLGILFRFLKTMGLDGYLGDIVVKVLVLESSPLIVVFLVALRSSSAINTEIAVMKVKREIDALAAFKVDIECYLFAPRILCFVLSTPMLTILFSISVILGSCVFCEIIFQMNALTYIEIIVRAISYPDIALLIIKSATFGFFISVIPLFHGWKTQYESTGIPVSVLNGMTGVFVSIFIVEVLSLSATFALRSL